MTKLEKGYIGQLEKTFNCNDDDDDDTGGGGRGGEGGGGNHDDAYFFFYIDNRNSLSEAINPKIISQSYQIGIICECEFVGVIDTRHMQSTGGFTCFNALVASYYTSKVEGG